MNKRYYHILLLCLLPWLGQAQNYYVEIQDATGYEGRIERQQILNDSAELITEVFFEQPTIQQQFKVFSAGFYLHNATMKNGREEVFEQIKQKAQQQTPYYLLLAKESNESGFYRKFWVDVQLPITRAYPCLSEVKVDFIRKRVADVANQVYASYDYKPFHYYKAEQAAMAELRKQLERFILCCTQTSNLRSSNACNCQTEQEICEELTSLGFVEFEDAKIIIKDTIAGQLTAIETNKRISVEKYGYNWDLTNDLNDLVKDLKSSNADANGIIHHIENKDCPSIDVLLNSNAGISLRGNTSSRSSGAVSFFQEIVVVDIGDKPKLFFKFLDTGKSDRVMNWVLKSLTHSKRGALEYVSVAMMMEKCYLDLDNVEEVPKQSKAYSNHSNYFLKAIELTFTSLKTLIF